MPMIKVDNKSLYWDDFERRVKETSNCLLNNIPIPIRRVSVFITNKCNLRCKYCNFKFGNKEISADYLSQKIKQYPDSIFHLTGGEPTVVKWLNDFINQNKHVRFHVNSNGINELPIIKNIKKYKISLDTNDKNEFFYLTGSNKFSNVIDNIKNVSKHIVTSVTCVINKRNLTNLPAFMKFCRVQFPNLYAVFFSVYKGDNKVFKLSSYDLMTFFYKVKPKLEKEMDKESLCLLRETIDQKMRLSESVRFPENSYQKKCYISMSERVIDFNNKEFNCSHLYRDNIIQKNNNKDVKCCYGCNLRLIKFNEEVENIIKEKKDANDKV